MFLKELFDCMNSAKTVQIHALFCVSFRKCRGISSGDLTFFCIWRILILY